MSTSPSDATESPPFAEIIELRAINKSWSLHPTAMILWESCDILLAKAPFFRPIPCIKAIWGGLFS